VCLKRGCGKTTLLRAAIGLLQPSSGRILLDGEDITRMRPHERVKRWLGYVPQGQQCFPQLTTEENLQLIADTRRDGTKLIAEALDLFPALGTLMSRRARAALRRSASAAGHRSRVDHPAADADSG
jgi:urea transport system ATP-binding protein